MNPSDELHNVPRVVVVGAGVAGLATAFLIREIGNTAGRDVNVSILEAQSSAGGATRTDHVDGYICEWGPNGFLDNEPATFNLVNRLNLTNRLLKANAAAAHRYIFHSGKLHDVPLKPAASLASDILPLSAKLRMAMDLLVPAKRDHLEETVYAFGRRRLGRAFSTYLLDPMVSGIFAGNAHELSLPAVFPRMVELEKEYGGLFRAMFALQKQAKRNGRASGGPVGANSVLHTFHDGMGELTNALAERMAGRLRLNRRVESLSRAGGRWQVCLTDERIEADAVILACPSFEAAEIVGKLAPDTADSLRDIRYAPVDVVCHGYRTEDIGHPLHGFGVLIPRSEGIRSLGCLWSDSIFTGQAPEGKHLLRTIIGGAHDPEVVRLSQAELDRLAFRDHQHILPIHKPPILVKTYRHPRGIAQYTLGHLQRVACTEELERHAPGVFFTGASYRGVSINGCVKDANRVAAAFWARYGVRV